mgnify:FL=1
MKPIKCNWDLVSIHWRDAFDGENGWSDTKEYKPKDATVVTVGWLWPDCLEGYVTLVTSYFPDEVPNLKTVGMPTHIPNGMIIAQTVIKQASVYLPEHPEQELPNSKMLHASSLDHPPFREKFRNESNHPNLHR